MGDNPALLKARSASRTSLDHPVDTLVKIHADTQSIEEPACLQTAKTKLVKYLGTVIPVVLAYGAQEPGRMLQDLITQADTLSENFTTELLVVSECSRTLGRGSRFIG